MPSSKVAVRAVVRSLGLAFAWDGSRETVINRKQAMSSREIRVKVLNNILSSVHLKSRSYIRDEQQRPIISFEIR